MVNVPSFQFTIVEAAMNSQYRREQGPQYYDKAFHKTHRRDQPPL